MQFVIAIALLVASAGCMILAVRSARTAEFWAALAAAMLMADTFVIQRARVLTIPFFFTFVIILLFWSARRSAERQDTEQE